MPASTSARISAITSREVLVVGLLLERRERLTTLTPASIIVANWREKIWSDFGLTFLKAMRAGLAARGAAP